jgi:hypothetical protein
MFTKYYKEWKLLMSEAPIAYDDETEGYAKKITKDPKTKTYWARSPDVNMKPEEIYEWVQHQIRLGTMVNLVLGGGIAKIARFNDGKTVFKYVYKDTEYTTPQLDTEVRISKEYGNTKYGKVFAKVLKNGKFWCISEYADQSKLDSNSFKLLTNVEYKYYTKFIKVAASFAVAGASL